MGPIEVIYGMIAAIIVLIGLARGYVKEMGATLIILVAIFILTFFEDTITSVATASVAGPLNVAGDNQTNLFLASMYTLAFTVLVFAGYVGRTLAFPGKMTGQPGAFILSLFVGIINGYLIAGTLWYYQDAYGYPWFDPFREEFTDLAQQMLAILPPVIFENPVLWVVPVAILLLVRVRG